MAALTSQTITQAAPNAGIKIVYVKGTSASNGDTIDVTGLTVVQGVALMATDGTSATVTLGGTNQIAVGNGSTKTWSGLAWGY